MVNIYLAPECPEKVMILHLAGYADVDYTESKSIEEAFLSWDKKVFNDEIASEFGLSWLKELNQEERKKYFLENLRVYTKEEVFEKAKQGHDWPFLLDYVI